MSRTIELLPGESLTLRSGITIVVPITVSAIYPTTISAAASIAPSSGSIEPEHGAAIFVIEQLTAAARNQALNLDDWSQIQKLAEHLARARRAQIEGWT
ncbi:hypothetical protein J2W32_004441 [Variovorax boronicumulans]|uniref:Uncharacterized protein n=1 Tax=Variovorax boronicumulans TaxID=436515 RepID=A0AAW8D3M1_9BURK|nr:hypothetical protein [Variovorax boronicumulans]MDP9895343.1 hypothetical protein [Variovorax boronicumulans]MDQ0055383.1 hypothetical protein [Variovorax boronicumulans]